MSWTSGQLQETTRRIDPWPCAGDCAKARPSLTLVDLLLVAGRRPPPHGAIIAAFIDLFCVDHQLGYTCTMMRGREQHSQKPPLFARHLLFVLRPLRGRQGRTFGFRIWEWLVTETVDTQRGRHKRRCTQQEKRFVNEAGHPVA
jgi:hypothetical protein